MLSLNKKLQRLLQPDLWVYLLILLISAAAAAAFGEFYIAGIEAFAALVVFLYAALNAKQRRKGIIRYMQNTLDAQDVAIRNDAPVAKVLLDLESEEILWANRLFCVMLGMREELIGTPLAAFLPDLDLSFLRDASVKTSPELRIGSRRYHIYGNVVSPKSDEYPGKLANLYFIDMTEYLAVKEEYSRSRPVVAMILVDNYDELTNNLTDNDVSALNVAINNAVRHWAEGTGGLLRRMERNRYLFIFEAQHLPGMIENKFFLLDEVRKVVNGAGIAATVSIGIGKDGASYAESYNFAGLGIEMALSRGGDQAVIKDRYNFNFYGARAKESGGRTKVKARVMASALTELISQSSHIFIMGHSNADLDSLGAAIGIQAICRKKGKKGRIVIDFEQNAVGELLKRMEEVPEYKDCFITGENALIMADNKSLLIIVDTNRPDQVEYRPLLNSMSRVVVVDHHRRAADYIEQVVLNHHEPTASSTAELVAELLQFAVDPKDVLPAEAMALMAGMVLDTKNFSVRTTGRTFDVAAFLRRLGADTVDVKRMMQNDFPTTVERYKIIQTARIYRDEIAIAVVDHEVGRVIAAQAADELINIHGITSSFVLFPTREKVIISARSIGDANVQVILERLGGGGNPATAGAQIPETDINAVVERLVESIDKFYEDMTKKETK